MGSQQHGSTQTIAMFRGKLLRVEHAATTGIVQLVFREAGQNQLCISTNLALAKLKTGKHYAVEGAYKFLGQKPYVHEPSVESVRQHLLSAWKFRLGAAAALVVLGGVGSVFAAPWRHATPAPQAIVNAASRTTTSGAVSGTSADTSTAAESPAATASTTTPSTATPVSKPKIVTPTKVAASVAAATPVTSQTPVPADTAAADQAAAQTAVDAQAAQQAALDTQAAADAQAAADPAAALAAQQTPQAQQPDPSQ